MNWREVLEMAELIRENLLVNVKESIDIAIEVLDIDFNKITID